VHIETERPLDVAAARKLLQDAPGVTVIDERQDGGYATAVSDAAGNDAVFVSRIREDIASKNGLCLWVVADNVRKGAALNSVQIAEILVKKFL
ncbi:MAG: Asd/ArgC dimerization domain-containing protein, partial [Pseudomonadota bacterium]